MHASPAEESLGSSLHTAYVAPALHFAAPPPAGAHASSGTDELAADTHDRQLGSS